MSEENIRIFAAGLLTVLILAFGIVYIVRITLRHRKNIALYKIDILAEMILLERERGRLALDLHNEFGTILCAVKMIINSFKITNKYDKNKIDITNEHIEQILRRIREISFDLMPNSLSRKGLVSALKELVDYLNKAGKIKFNYEFDNDLPLNKNKSINVYRITQELFQNAIKHANASEVNINLRSVKGKAVLGYSDNGVGFTYSEYQSDIGLGLKSMLRRAKVVGGKMFLDSNPGRGTRYSFEIPI